MALQQPQQHKQHSKQKQPATLRQQQKQQTQRGQQQHLQQPLPISSSLLVSNTGRKSNTENTETFANYHCNNSTSRKTSVGCNRDTTFSKPSHDTPSTLSLSSASLSAQLKSSPTGGSNPQKPVAIVKNSTLASSVLSTDTGSESSRSSGGGYSNGSMSQDNLTQTVRAQLASTSKSADSSGTEDVLDLKVDEARAGDEQTGSIFRLGFTNRCQDHLKVFFSMHHKLFDLVAFYVVMFAINGQMTSLPTRLEWIGFCVQSIVALRRAFQTSIKHGLGLTSFLGMLDLLVGQLFLHQDRLGLLPTVANILVYFYVINLTRGLVFGDSVSCLLWFLFGLVDIYRKDPSSASIIDLTAYRVIPVHTVGFGLYILMSELVDVMLHSTEPDPIQGRYLNYVGTQKEGPVSLRSSSKRTSSTRSVDPSSNLRFELCITEITPFTVSFCLNALSETPSQDQSMAQNSSVNTSSSVTPETNAAGGLEVVPETVDLSSIKIGPASSSSSSRQSKTTSTPKIISTSEIVIHVNYIPWHQVQYHFPDEQSFTVYGLTPSTDYEIEMKVHQFSSFVSRVGTRAAPPGMPMPVRSSVKQEKPAEPASKVRNRKNKKNQKSQQDPSEKGMETNRSKATGATNVAAASLSNSVIENPLTMLPGDPHSETASNQPVECTAAREQKNTNQLLFEQLQASIQASVDAANATKVALKKLRRDQNKSESLLRQELEGIGRGQSKALIQDQKRRQKLSFVQESIKQADAHASALQEELLELRQSTLSTQPKLEDTMQAIQTLEQQVQSTLANTKSEIMPLKTECQRLQTEIKRLETEQSDWASKTTQLHENEVAPLQLRLQRLEQQQVVWKVAAEASKEKAREANLRIAALEEEVQKKSLQAQQLENEIQMLGQENAQLMESVEQAMELWESLEREPDPDVDLDVNMEKTVQGSSLLSQQFPQIPLPPLRPKQLNPLGDSIEGNTHDAYWASASQGVDSDSNLWLSLINPLNGSSADGGQPHSRTNGMKTHTFDPIVTESLWDLSSKSTRIE
ncbi:hypothetical protein BCR41DRAFT_394518 [Lobosporangium transversale]|uniref:Uncharacterized protein n=1 Tax=Lobosporangium transversale TaxID=64571 RepID=A0A1Y2GWL3_9FUNG|nr:hypothetical protein BCR41DRAFT_394518 [Lobosporangium transversale]ORZ21737.1 hypothetical protein BCR41DRAFT_394518 [Lobosporangium transversale]|eukprot:XP_021882988.1 hypothetical protein BCR41DRAFT_394518 [Lobosporangium transversale]